MPTTVYPLPVQHRRLPHRPKLVGTPNWCVSSSFCEVSRTSGAFILPIFSSSCATSAIRAPYYSLYHQHRHYGLTIPVLYHEECSAEVRFVRADIQVHLDQKIKTLKEEQQRNRQEMESMFASSQRALETTFSEELQRSRREIDEALNDSGVLKINFDEGLQSSRREMNEALSDLERRIESLEIKFEDIYERLTESPMIFVSENTSETPLWYKAPEDTTKTNTLCKDASQAASDIVFVPVSTPSFVGFNNVSTTTVDELAAGLDALMEVKDREIADLQERTQTLQANFEDLID